MEETQGRPVAKCPAVWELTALEADSVNSETSQLVEIFKYPGWEWSKTAKVGLWNNWWNEARRGLFSTSPVQLKTLSFISGPGTCGDYMACWIVDRRMTKLFNLLPLDRRQKKSQNQRWWYRWRKLPRWRRWWQMWGMGQWWWRSRPCGGWMVGWWGAPWGGSKGGFYPLFSPCFSFLAIIPLYDRLYQHWYMCLRCSLHSILSFMWL